MPSRQPKPIIHGRDHAAGGADPIPGLGTGGGDTLDSAILGHDPAGFWKLNEDSGTIAYDSSGNGLDMATSGSFLAPVWAQTAGPPGEQTADFENGTGGLLGTGARVSRPWAALTGNFTAGLFYKRNTTNTTLVMGQGDPSRAGGSGWQIENNSAGLAEPNKNRPQFAMKGAGAAVAVNQLLADTWAFVVAVHDAAAHQGRLYVNGLLQATIDSTSYTPVTSWDLWIGHDGPGPTSGNAVVLPQFTGSYAFLYPVALSGDQLLEMYNLAGATGYLDDGLVLTSDGSGASSWEEPTIRVAVPAGRYGEVTLGTNLAGTDNGGGRITIDAATGGGVTADTIWDTKGDLAAATGADAATKLPVGSNGQVLTADSTQTTGLKWATPAAGGTTPSDTAGWMPLTTVAGGVPDLVWDATDNLIPTYGPF